MIPQHSALARVSWRRLRALERRLDLDRPDAAARLGADLAGRHDRLEALSAALRREQAAFAASQATAWSDAIRCAVAAHAGRAADRDRWRWPRRCRAGGKPR